jgi:hypothetical protein
MAIDDIMLVRDVLEEAYRLRAALADREAQVERLEAERDALQRRVDREDRLLPEDWWPGDEMGGTNMTEPDTTADVIREDEDWGVHAFRELLREGDRLQLALAESEARVARLRSYSDDLAWWLALDTIEVLMEEHLQPGDLGDETEGAGRDRTLDT